MSRIGVLKRRCVVLLLSLGACSRGGQAVPQTAADAEPVAACSCPKPPPEQLHPKPTPEQTIDTLNMAYGGIRACVGDSGIVTVKIVIEGATGTVVEVVEVDSPKTGSEACVARALRRICFPRFQQPVYKVQFPFDMGRRARRGGVSPVTPQCPASAVRWDREAQRADEAARASTRQRYHAKYGATCEAALAGQPPLPLEALAPAIAADVKKAVLSARIDEVHGCYRDALEGWPDLAGEIGLQLVIDTTGTVESSQVSSSTFAMPELGCCLRQVTRTLQFPAPRARTSISYDFSFRP
jgi:hypothetical protein